MTSSIESLQELVELAQDAIDDWDDDCKACGFGPGIVKDLALELLESKSA